MKKQMILNLKRANLKSTKSTMSMRTFVTLMRFMERRIWVGLHLDSGCFDQRDNNGGFMVAFEY